MQSHGENNASAEAGYRDKFWSKADIEMGDLRNSVPASRSVALSLSQHQDMCVDTSLLPTFLVYMEITSTSTRSTPGWGQNVIILAINKQFIQKAELIRKKQKLT